MGEGVRQKDAVRVGGAAPWMRGIPAAGFDDMVRRPDRWARLLRGATLAGLLFGLVGPYNSFTANPATRLFYWTALFWAGTLILWPAVALALSAGARRGFPTWFGAAVAVLVGALPLAAVAAAGCYLFWPVRASAIRPLEWYVQTIVIALPAVAAALWFELGQAQASPGRDLPASPREWGTASPPLPEHLKEAVLCLQMEDHHVRVHTIGRSRMHLAPLRQIAAELGDERGLQVHRSWWVARDAVRRCEEDGRAILLVLTNGLRVPVARNRVAQLRALGWLDRGAP